MSARLTKRIESLKTVIELADGRISSKTLDEAAKVISHVDQRTSFSGDDTVIALAGSTGSGKSSLFNLLSATSLAQVGLKRPTTSQTMAAYWGQQLPDELLDWLQIADRHLVTDGDQALNGLILLDMPDHDSTNLANRDEVKRLVKLVDQLIWVVDPQKYADNALHEGFLIPLADHADVMTIVVNQADRLTPQQLASAVADLREILNREGLNQTKIISTSALTGKGVRELRRDLIDLAKTKQAASSRLSADIDQIASRLKLELGDVNKPGLSSRSEQLVKKFFIQTAGIEAITEAVSQTVQQRAAILTGWPLTSWKSKTKSDRLQEFQLDQSVQQEIEKPSTQNQADSPTTGDFVDSVLQTVADEASKGLPQGWAANIRNIAFSYRAEIPARIEHTVKTTNLMLTQGLGWQKTVQTIQWIVFILTVNAGVWLVADLVWHFVNASGPNFVVLASQIVILLAGLISGEIIAYSSNRRALNDARDKADYAQQELTKVVTGLADELVLDPINQELARYRKTCQEVAAIIS